MFNAIAGFGVSSRAIKQGLVELKVLTPRDFAHDRHFTVDERPYGGGPGMVMMVQPLRDAIVAAKAGQVMMQKSSICLPKGEHWIKPVLLSW